MKITFLGATKTVTGSNFLVEAAGKRFLVDCGMWQGNAELEMQNAEEFEFEPNQIDYINAHGTSTPLNDKLETLGIKKVFGKETKLMVSSTKGNTGHLLGAAGGVEAIITVKALQDGFVPATINYSQPDPECDLDIVPNVGRHQNIKYAMSNSLGFGGHNACIVFKKYE